MPTKCGHGLGWDVDCPKCEAVSMGERLKWLAKQAGECAKFYEQNPVMAYAATPDIYKAIQKLAIAIEKVTK